MTHDREDCCPVLYWRNISYCIVLLRIYLIFYLSSYLVLSPSSYGVRLYIPAPEGPIITNIRPGWARPRRDPSRTTRGFPLFFLLAKAMYIPSKDKSAFCLGPNSFGIWESSSLGRWMWIYDVFEGDCDVHSLHIAIHQLALPYSLTHSGRKVGVCSCRCCRLTCGCCTDTPCSCITGLICDSFP